MKQLFPSIYCVVQLFDYVYSVAKMNNKQIFASKYICLYAVCRFNTGSGTQHMLGPSFYSEDHLNVEWMNNLRIWHQRDQY